MLRGRRAAEALTADGLHDRWQALALGARLFREEVAGGKAEAEARLRERLSPATLEAPALQSARSAGADPTTHLSRALDTPALRAGGSTNEASEGPQ
jgi:hypothetical protein